MAKKKKSLSKRFSPSPIQLILLAVLVSVAGLAVWRASASNHRTYTAGRVYGPYLANSGGSPNENGSGGPGCGSASGPTGPIPNSGGAACNRLGQYMPDIQAWKTTPKSTTYPQIFGPFTPTGFGPAVDSEGNEIGTVVGWIFNIKVNASASNGGTFRISSNNGLLKQFTKLGSCLGQNAAGMKFYTVVLLKQGYTLSERDKFYGHYDRKEITWRPHADCLGHYPSAPDLHEGTSISFYHNRGNLDFFEYSMDGIAEVKEDLIPNYSGGGGPLFGPRLPGSVPDIGQGSGFIFQADSQILRTLTTPKANL